LRRGQRALGPLGRLRGQRDRASQEGRGGGEPAARLRPSRGALELQGHLLVGSRCRRGQMPGTPVRVGLPIGRLRQRQMRCAALPGAADRYIAERTSGWRNVTRSPIASSPSASGPSAAAGLIPSRSAARHNNSGSPTGSAAATSNSTRASSESSFSRATKLSSIRPVSA
jgi:hypothetical protein